MSTEKDKDINWNDVVDKEAIGIDGLDLDTIKEVGNTYVIAQKGLINKKKYHLPISSVESYDGGQVKFSINESDLDSYEEKEENTFDNYSSFKASDMSKEIGATIPLISEKLEVTKKITEDNIKIIKEPVKETKTVQIELMHEKVTIEKRPVSMSADNNIEKNTSLPNENTSFHESNKESELKGLVDSKTEIIIPIKREEPIITKKSFVREELIIKKKPVTETRTISEEITNEEVRYDNKKIGEGGEGGEGEIKKDNIT